MGKVSARSGFQVLGVLVFIGIVRQWRLNSIVPVEAGVDWLNLDDFTGVET